MYKVCTGHIVGHWSPIAALHNNQEEFHRVNARCDLRQFVLLSITIDTKSEAPAKFFYGIISVTVCHVCSGIIIRIYPIQRRI